MRFRQRSAHLTRSLRTLRNVAGPLLLILVLFGLGEFLERVRVGIHRLLKEPIEEHSSTSAVPPVESERVLIEVVVEVFR